MSLSISALNHQIDDGFLRRQLLADISLNVSQGECIALMGDSGSGKTTLLNLIAGLEPIQQGSINIAGQAVADADDKCLSQLRKLTIAIIFQQFNLLSGLNVNDNISFSARLAKRYQPAHCLHLAQTLGIDHLLEHFPSTLSGGEMQRVAIARALSARPKLLLADEPTGNLDNNNSTTVVKQLVLLAKAHNTALLVVTHNRDIADKMDKIYRLNDGLLTLIKAH